MTDIRIGDIDPDASGNGAPPSLDDARRIVRELIERSKEDPGAPYEMKAMAALNVLREGDRPEFERARTELRSWVRVGELDRALKPLSEEEEDSHADALVRLAADAELFHDVAAVDEGYATVEVSGHHETYRINSKDFKRWLIRRFYEEQKKPPEREELQKALQLLESMAQFDGEPRVIHLRVAGHVNEAIHLDLGDPSWRTIVIVKSDWSLAESSKVKFRRTRGMKALPEPIRGGSLDDLRPFINVESDDDFRLLVAWLVASFLPLGPYTVLALHGEQGSSKSTVARLLRRLLDPNAAELRGEPRNLEDLMVAASAGWVIAFDNLSRLMQWLSDALCRLSTGGGFSTRELYTNRDEAIFEAMRPTILTGINVLAESGDLLDRAVIIELKVIEDEDREPERKFWSRFEKQAPSILGALLDALSGLMEALPGIEVESLQRMADFHISGCALEKALGWKGGTFTDIYERNRAEAVGLTLEASPVGRHFLLWMRDKADWTGTATELQDTLVERVGESKISKIKAWPATPKGLSAILRRLAPALRRVGLDVRFERVGDEGERTILVSRVPASRGKNASGASVRQGDQAPDASDALLHPVGGTPEKVAPSPEAPPDASDASDALLHAFGEPQERDSRPTSPSGPDQDGLDPDEEVLA